MSEPVVFFSKPENWDEMTQDERDEFTNSILDQMGFPE